LLISNHHLLMDGWSAPILVRELLEVYAQRGSAASLPRVTPYRDYLTFIARQDRAAGLAAWREALAGLEEGTRLVPRRAGRERADGGLLRRGHVRGSRPLGSDVGTRQELALSGSYRSTSPGRIDTTPRGRRNHQGAGPDCCAAQADASHTVLNSRPACRASARW
jgi:hypothetical protein